MSVRFKKKGIDKVRRQIETELNRQIQIGVDELRKDSEKFLEILLKRREETGEDAINCNMDEFAEIPNVKFNIKAILDDLKIHGCITNASSVFIGGGMAIYLTMEGIDYFEDKEKQYQEVHMSNNTNNFYGNISNMQLQQGTVNSTQTQKIISMETIDFDKVSEFVAKIKKYDTLLEDEFGDKATEVRQKITEIETLVQKKENPSKIKMLLIELKNLSIGVAGSLIATGIVEGIKLLLT